MNKLNKIFLSIIIILTISLAIMTYLYFDMRKNAYKFRDSYVDAVTELMNLIESNDQNENNGIVKD